MWLSLLLALSSVRVETGRATVYYPGDGHCGPTRADGRPFRVGDDHVAHRRIALGTRGILCSGRTGKCVATAVRDRGPFGTFRANVPHEACPKRRAKKLAPKFRSCDEGRPMCWRGSRGCYRVRTKPKPGWKYRGHLDLTRPVAKALGHRAFDRVTFCWGRRGRHVSLLGLRWCRRVGRRRFAAVAFVPGLPSDPSYSRQAPLAEHLRETPPTSHRTEVRGQALAARDP